MTEITLTARNISFFEFLQQRRQRWFQELGVTPPAGIDWSVPYHEGQQVSIRDVLFGPLVNSETRLEAMLHLLMFSPASVFWSVFIDTWSSCDATWWLRQDLLSALQQHHAVNPGPSYLTGKNAAFYAALPPMVEVYRGCSRSRVRGIPWTTDRAVAERFARGHRGIPVPQPVIARAIIPKKHIFVTLTDRSESEMLLDPRRLRKLVVEEYAPQAAPAALPA